MNIKKHIRELVKEPISSKYIEDLVKGVNFVPYSNIKYMRSINDVLGPNNMAVIIYLLGSEVGHFVCIFKDNNIIQYCNSYGMEPDDDLKIVPREVRVQLNETEPYLFKLMVESGYPCEYNEYKLQGPRTSTCGRHCIVRLWNKHLDSEGYARRLYTSSVRANCTMDELVTILTL